MKKIFFNVFSVSYLILVILLMSAAIFFLKLPLAQAATLGIPLIVFLLPVFMLEPSNGLALVGFCLPFERVPQIEVGGMSIKINHILIVMVFVSFLMHAAVNKKLVIPSEPIRWLIILFLLGLFLSIPSAINTGRAVQTMAFVLLMFLIYFTTTLVANSKESIIKVIKGVLIGAMVSGVFGIFQFFADFAGAPLSVTLLKEGYDKGTFGFARIQAFSQEPLYFANYIFIPLLLSTLIVLNGKTKEFLGKNFNFILIGVLLIDFILALSRGAYLGAVVAVLVLLITQAKKVFTIKNIFIVSALIFLVGGISYYAVSKTDPESIDLFVTHATGQDYNQGESVVSRLDASKQALELFSSNPILGVGLGNFGPAVQGDPSSTPEGGWFIVNNEYLELLAENGLVGLILFILVIISLFAYAIKAYLRTRDKTFKPVLMGLIIALIGILVQYASFSTLYIIHIWFLMGLIVAISSYINKNEKNT